MPLTQPQRFWSPRGNYRGKVLPRVTREHLPRAQLGIIARGDGIPRINLTIAVDSTNINLFSLAGSPTAKCIVNCVIAAGVTVGSVSTASAAFTVGSGWVAGTQLNLTIIGEIQGKGGLAGNGSAMLCSGNYPTPPSTSVASSATSGAAGGLALDASGFAIRISNGGAVRGGGGGGGGGGGAGNIRAGAVDLAGGGGGGGGRGHSSTSGGAGGGVTNTSDNGYDSNGGVSGQQPGNAGGTGSKSAAGSGGPFVQCPNPPQATAGAGGSGGAGGSVGATGNSGTANITGFESTSAGASGGAAGACTAGNANISWLTTGTREGALN